MPMSMVTVGESFRIHHINGKDEVRAHLAKLGFVSGVEGKVVSRMAGNVIVAIKDSRIALNRSLANRIQV